MKIKKLAASLLILVFSITNITYGYEPYSTLRQLRTPESVAAIEQVESFIRDYDHHAEVIDNPLEIAGSEPGMSRLNNIALEELTNPDFSEGNPMLNRMLGLFKAAGISELSKALEFLALQRKLQRFNPGADEWVIREGGQEHFINGHASDARITVRAGLTQIREAAVLGHELLDYFNVQSNDGRHLGPEFEHLLMEALIRNDHSPLQPLSRYIASLRLNVFERQTEEARLLASSSHTIGARHYTALTAARPSRARDFRFVQGEAIGQDPEVVKGYANKLWFSKRMVDDFNRRGIFVFDIDKTIADRNKNLLDPMVSTIEQLMREGHLVVIITGQPISVQHKRIIDPIENDLLQNLVVMTNEGAVVHHFLPDAREYIVLNDFTRQWYYNQEELGTLMDIVRDFTQDRGIEFVPTSDGPPENRENVQLAFKIEANVDTRIQYAREIEEEFTRRGLEGFQCTISGATTMSLWKENIGKLSSGIGYLRESGFNAKQMSYYGDEYYEYGNDLCMLEDEDMLIFAVGRYSEALEGHDNTVFVGAGPYATEALLDDFIRVRREQGSGENNYRRLIRDIAMKHTDWETLTQHYSDKGMDSRQTLEALRNNWVVPGTQLASLLDRLAEGPLEGDDFRRFYADEAIHRASMDRLRCVHEVLREYRVGASFVETLYEAALGKTLESDFNAAARSMHSILLSAEKQASGAASNEYLTMRGTAKFKRLRNALGGFFSILEETLGRNSTGKLKGSLRILTGQASEWVQNSASVERVSEATNSGIKEASEALSTMLNPNGAYPWMLRVVGGRLPFFHSRIDITIDPEDYFPDYVKEDDENQGIGGIVGISGGGGSRMMGSVLLDTMLHHVLLPGADKTAFTMVVPSEDDGGSSSYVAALIAATLGVKLPAMGDIVNAYSGLTLGQPNAFNEPQFQFLYNIFRSRFPKEGVGAMDSELYQIAYGQMQGLERSELPRGEEDWRKLVGFLFHMHGIMNDFDQVSLEGNSLGNIYWAAYNLKSGAIPVRHEGSREELVKMDQDKYAAGQRAMARAIGLDGMTVLSSNLNPGTLYAIMDEIELFETMDDKEKPTFIAMENRKGLIECNGRRVIVQEEGDLEKKDIIDRESGHTYAYVPINDGESLLVYNRGTTFDLDVGVEATLFRTEIRKKKDALECRHTTGAEVWGDWIPLTNDELIVGIGDNQNNMRAKSADQLQWGARVALPSAAAYNGMVRVTLDRMGVKTLLRWSDGTQRLLKGRVIVKQTKITETYHHSSIIKLGMTEGRIPDTYGHVLKAVNEAKVGIVIGPGSMATSIIPVLLIKEIREALKRKAAEGLPVIFITNANKDNETAYNTISDTFDLIERSVGEPIFAERGGFITDIIVNDTSDASENLLRLADLTDSLDKTRLRRAEVPRGLLGLEEGEADRLRARYGDGLRIYVAPLLVSMLKEVRGGAPEESIGYGAEELGEVIEVAIMERNRDAIRSRPLYRRALQLFHSEQTLGAALMRAQERYGEVNQLKALETLVGSIENKRSITGGHLRGLAPQVIATNLHHSVIETTKERIPKPMTEAMAASLNSYLGAGGYMVITTGAGYSTVASRMFSGENCIDPEYRSRIYFITTSGGEVHRGDSMLFRSNAARVDVYSEVQHAMRDMVNIYCLEGKDISHDNRGDVVAFKWHAYNNLSWEEVQQINRNIKNNTDMSRDERRKYSIKWKPGIVVTYDLRDKVVKRLNERFSGLGGPRIVAEKQGTGTIDIRPEDLSEGNAFKELLNLGTEPIAHISTRNMLITGRNVFPLASAAPGITATLQTQVDPGALFLDNALPLELTPGQKNPEWSTERFREIVDIATEALIVDIDDGIDKIKSHPRYVDFMAIGNALKQYCLDHWLPGRNQTHAYYLREELTGFTPGKAQTLLLYAEPLLSQEHALLDLEETLASIDNRALQNIVIYAEDPREATIVNCMISDINEEYGKSFNVIIKTRAELETRNFHPEVSEAREMEGLVNLVQADLGITAQDILGIVRGRSKDPQGLKALSGNLRIPVVVFAEMSAHHLYALAQIMKEVVAARKTDSGWFILLPPISTHQVLEDYRRYKQAIELLKAL